MTEKLKVIIVDDEPYARETLCSILSETESDYTVAGDFFSAEKALDYLKTENIYIVITDIKMPKIDGIRFMELAKAINPAIQFIVLSAFNDFDIVRNSFKLGIADYIVKTEISKERIHQALEIARKNLLSGRDIDHDTVIKEGFLKQLILAGSNEEKILSKLKSYDFSLKMKNFKIIIIKIIDFENYIKQDFECDEFLVAYGINNIILEIAQSSSFSTETFYNNRGEFVVMCEFPEGSGENVRLRETENFYSSLKASLKSYIGRDIHAGVSGYKTKKKCVCDIYSEAVTALKMVFFRSGDEIVFFKESYTRDPDTSEAYIYRERITKILTDISTGGSASPLYPMQYNFNNGTEKLIPIIKDIYDNCMFSVYEYAKKENLTEYIKNDYNYYIEYLKQFGTLSELNKWLGDMFMHLQEAKHSSGGVIQRIENYIVRNYQKPLTLNDMGETFGMNGNYIGRIFKKELGIGFCDFLSKVRIEKAIELMKEKRYNISQIARMTGFKNIEHFSRTFKKATNKSPKSYYNEL